MKDEAHKKNWDLYIEAKEVYSLYNYWAKKGKKTYKAKARKAKKEMIKYRTLAYSPDHTPLQEKPKATWPKANRPKNEIDSWSLYRDIDADISWVFE